jgi:tRNA nucleotidyltransferase (CCA-adding enzyme)
LLEKLKLKLKIERNTMLDMTKLEHAKIYITGGYVRDRLLNLEPHDHDFVVCGATPDDMIAAGFIPIEATAFPVFHHPLTRDEFALARTEKKTGPGYHGFECFCDPTISVEDDLIRRDLTFNSMAREVVGWNKLGHAKLSDKVIDPYGGQRDLSNGIIQHTSDAFTEDSVRVLRAFRFAARYDFGISVETYKLMKQMVRDGELHHLTAERVWQEFEKTMTESCGTYDFLHMLKIVGALDILAPEIVDNLSALQFSLDEADMFESSVAIKCAIITSHMNQQAVGDFWRRMKAPNDVVWLASTSSMVRFTFGHCWEGTAKQILSTLKAINAYNNVDGMTDVLRVVSAVNSSWADRANAISTCQWITKDISFGSLTKEQQATLKGKEIGDAIDSLRVTTIKTYLRIFVD